MKKNERRFLSPSPFLFSIFLWTIEYYRTAAKLQVACSPIAMRVCVRVRVCACVLICSSSLSVYFVFVGCLLLFLTHLRKHRFPGRTRAVINAQWRPNFLCCARWKIQFLLRSFRTSRDMFANEGFKHSISTGLPFEQWCSQWMTSRRMVKWSLWTSVFHVTAVCIRCRSTCRCP